MKSMHSTQVKYNDRLQYIIVADKYVIISCSFRFVDNTMQIIDHWYFKEAFLYLRLLDYVKIRKND